MWQRDLAASNVTIIEPRRGFQMGPQTALVCLSLASSVRSSCVQPNPEPIKTMKPCVRTLWLCVCVYVMREGGLQGLMHSWGKFTPGAIAKKVCCCQSEMHGQPVQRSVLPLSGCRAVAQRGLDQRDHLTLVRESCYATTRQLTQKIESVSGKRLPLLCPGMLWKKQSC